MTSGFIVGTQSCSPITLIILLKKSKSIVSQMMDCTSLQVYFFQKDIVLSKSFFPNS